MLNLQIFPLMEEFICLSKDRHQTIQCGHTGLDAGSTLTCTGLELDIDVCLAFCSFSHGP